MKQTGLFFLYLSVCLGLGALLTPLVLHIGWIDLEPHRVMGRLTQGFILLGLWPLLRRLGLNHRAALGYGISPSEFRHALAVGWGIGLVLLGLLALALMILGIRVPAIPAAGPAAFLAKVVQALVAGLLIGLLEETFFRGALYAAIRRRNRAAAAVFWSAALYAGLHFLKPHPLPPDGAFEYAESWRMFTGVFTGFFQVRSLDSLTALFLAGLLLGLVRERTGQIGGCVGLHAGWVFVIQVLRYLTDSDPASPLAWLTGSYDEVIGWLAAAWIGVLVLFYGWQTWRKGAA